MLYVARRALRRELVLDLVRSPAPGFLLYPEVAVDVHALPRLEKHGRRLSPERPFAQRAGTLGSFFMTGGQVRVGCEFQVAVGGHGHSSEIQRTAM
jgi:hypothetical protein